MYYYTVTILLFVIPFIVSGFQSEKSNIRLESFHSPIFFTKQHNKQQVHQQQHSKFTTVSTSAKCTSFSFTSEEQALVSTCGNAVDYNFYLPAGFSLEYLEIKARSLLNNSGLLILPNACQVALKKEVCSNIYLKCPTGINLTNYLTYNYDIYSDVGLVVPMPFQRPCKELCVNTNTQCLGLLGLLGLTNDCDATYDYSDGLISLLPYQYDSGNNSAVCNAMTATFTIGSQLEPYIGGTSGACYGIVDEVYVPPSSAVSSALAPLLPSYIIQSLIDSELLASFNALPAWVSEDCHLDLKKYFCRSYMIKPAAVSYETAFTAAGALPYLSLFEEAGVNVATLVTESVIIPAYPSYDVCTSYATTCAAFIKLAAEPSLVPNCSATSKATGILVRSYPTTTQVILELPIVLSSTTTLYVPFSSSPDDVSTAVDNSYATACPDGFVVPDDPDDYRVDWIQGTGCAVACRLPLYSTSEYGRLNGAAQVLYFIGIPASLVVLIVWLADPKLRNQHLVIMMSVFYLITAIVNTLFSLKPLDSACSNNAVQVDLEDGISNICSAVSMINISFLSAVVVAWTLFFSDLALRVMGTNTEKLRYVQIGTVVILAGLITALWGGYKVYGYPGGMQYCLVSLRRLNENIYDMPILFLPLMIGALSSLFWFGVLAYSFIKKSGSIAPMIISDDNNNSKIDVVEKGKGSSSVATKKISSNTSPMSPLFLLQTPFLFMLVFFTIYVFMFAYRIQAYTHSTVYYNGFASWAECAFTYFDGKTNNWKDVCGYIPKNQIIYSTMSAYYMIPSLGPLFFSAIFLIGRKNCQNFHLFNMYESKNTGKYATIEVRASGKVHTFPGNNPTVATAIAEDLQQQPHSGSNGNSNGSKVIVVKSSTTNPLSPK